MKHIANQLTSKHFICAEHACMPCLMRMCNGARGITIDTEVLDHKKIRLHLSAYNYLPLMPKMLAVKGC